MGWVAPSTRVTGELITAAIWNTDLKDNLIDLNSRATIGYFQGYSNAFSVGSGGGNTQMDLQHENQKVNMTHSTVTNPHLVFPVATGLYRVSAYVVWDDVVGGARFALLGMSGGEIQHSYETPANGGQATHSFTATAYATSSDYFYLQVWQNSGAAVSVTVYLDVVRELS